jgi:hypothetical protein
MLLVLEFSLTMSILAHLNRTCTSAYYFFICYALPREVEEVNKKKVYTMNARLMTHNDPGVRLNAVFDLDISLLPAMMCDKDDVVRAAVARRIDPSYLPRMMNDEHHFVRLAVARRIDVSYLPEMMNDEHHEVRYAVARKIDKKNALLMNALDENKDVRQAALNNVLGIE